MPDKNGVRYLRTRRKPQLDDGSTGVKGAVLVPGGMLYRRVWPDGSSNEVWVSDSGKNNSDIPHWLIEHIVANDFDGGN